MSTPSKTTVPISGLEVHVYGLQELPSTTPVDIVFLLHGRTGEYLHMEPMAHAILAKADNGPKDRRGLIVVSFDQRNHGHRTVAAKGNQGWKEGNEMHA